jgi:hypothetical protein
MMPVKKAHLPVDWLNQWLATGATTQTYSSLPAAPSRISKTSPRRRTPNESVTDHKPVKTKKADAMKSIDLFLG